MPSWEAQLYRYYTVVASTDAESSEWPVKIQGTEQLIWIEPQPSIWGRVGKQGLKQSSFLESLEASQFREWALAFDTCRKGMRPWLIVPWPRHLELCLLLLLLLASVKKASRKLCTHSLCSVWRNYCTKSLRNRQAIPYYECWIYLVLRWWVTWWRQAFLKGI